MLAPPATNTLPSLRTDAVCNHLTLVKLPVYDHPKQRQNSGNENYGRNPPVEFDIPGFVAHISVTNNGKQIACGEQHELTIHTDVFDAHWLVTLSQGVRIEQSIPGAQ